jgi:quinoprotein relay system zinc metallohydrolase 2
LRRDLRGSERHDESTVARAVNSGRALGRRVVAAFVVALAIAADALPESSDALAVSEIADGVFVHRGVHGDIAPENLGDLANIGFVVGSRCVAVIDTGGSAVVGERLRAAIRKVSALPICYVINTHVHPDHVFGNAAFKAEHAEFVGHAKLPAAFAQRGATYLNALKRNLGSAAAGSEVVAPSRTVQDVLELDLGGRSLTLKAWRTAHTDNDLTVWDERTQTMFLSDLLFVEHTPVIDGSLRGWLDVSKELRALKVRQVVPGHGPAPAPWPASLDAQERYLNVILDEVRAALKQRLTIQQAVDQVGLSEQNRWAVFDLFHRRNVTAAYAELEWED